MYGYQRYGRRAAGAWGVGNSAGGASAVPHRVPRAGCRRQVSGLLPQAALDRRRHERTIDHMAADHGGLLVGRPDLGSGQSRGMAAVLAIHLHQPRPLDVASRGEAAALGRHRGRPAAVARTVAYLDADARRGGGRHGRIRLAMYGFGLLRYPAGAAVVHGVVAARHTGGAERRTARRGDRGAVATRPGEHARRRRVRPIPR